MTAPDQGLTDDRDRRRHSLTAPHLGLPLRALRRRGELWHNRDFLRFWTGESISFVGSEVTRLALPLTAVLILHATPGQMGLLAALGNLPFLFVGLMAGVWVDRMRRRSLLIATDLVSAVLLASIPASFLLGRLSIVQLYAVMLLTGTAYVVSMVAYQSFLPSLVERRLLVEGNSKLEVSSSLATVVGPGVGGLLVELLSAPVAIAVDAASFLASAMFLGSIHVQEPPPKPRGQREPAGRQILEGLRLVGSNPVLRSIVSCGTMHNFFSRMIDALYVVYLVRELGVSPLLLGTILAFGGPGALVGAIFSQAASRRFGLGKTLIAAQALTGISRILIPVAGGSLVVEASVLMLGNFLLGVSRPIFNVNQVSLRQAITPDHLQGRVNATMRFIMWSITPLGALLGGFLASYVSIDKILWLAAAGVLLSSLWVVPLRNLKDPPAHVDEARDRAPLA